ncbi:MAG: ATP-binding protein, partial [Planctomycetota bacterium]
RSPKGKGLGMSISYSIITRHDGKIDVESERGKGSTFTIGLPRKM